MIFCINTYMLAGKKKNEKKNCKGKEIYSKAKGKDIT